MYMKKLTGIQRVTIILILASLVWEIAVRIWMASLPAYDPVIRVDLLFIIPLLAVFITISIFQIILRKQRDENK